MTVYLLGAGPGDPGLLTLRGAEVLAGADVVVYDRLSVGAVLDMAPAAAERVNVGKMPGQPRMSQGEINQLLVEHGRTGRQVVRLKGGDPLVFARGGEEARALAEAGVGFEIIPGITSAFAAPAYAGIPVTLRHSSTSVTVITGHEAPGIAASEIGLSGAGSSEIEVPDAGLSKTSVHNAGGGGDSSADDSGEKKTVRSAEIENGSSSGDDALAQRSVNWEATGEDAAEFYRRDDALVQGGVNWDAAAQLGGTLVILMGVVRWDAIAERLLAAGMSPDTPAAAVCWGTRPSQRTTRATLATLGQHPLEAPSVIVVGEVAAQELEWFEKRPLFGKRVVVTRPAAQNASLCDMLARAGAEPIPVPLIEIVAAAEQSDAGLPAEMEADDREAEAAAEAATERADAGLSTEREADDREAEAAAEAAAGQSDAGLPAEMEADDREAEAAAEAAAGQSDAGPPSAAAEIRTSGASLKVAAERLGDYDWVILTSANGARSLLSAINDARDFGKAKVAAIGPATAEVLKAANIRPDLVPSSYIAEALLEELLEEEMLGATASVAPSEADGDNTAASANHETANETTAQIDDMHSKSPVSAANGETADGTTVQIDDIHSKGMASAANGGTAMGGSLRPRALIARAAVARDVLPEGLRAAGWEVDVVEAYRTEGLEVSDAARAEIASSDVITFASPSAVEQFVKTDLAAEAAKNKPPLPTSKQEQFVKTGSAAEIAENKPPPSTGEQEQYVKTGLAAEVASGDTAASIASISDELAAYEEQSRPERPTSPIVACIGPITADAARKLGLEVTVEAAEHTARGLVEALEKHFANSG